MMFGVFVEKVSSLFSPFLEKPRTETKVRRKRGRVEESASRKDLTPPNKRKKLFRSPSARSLFNVNLKELSARFYNYVMGNSPTVVIDDSEFSDCDDFSQNTGTSYAYRSNFTPSTNERVNTRKMIRSPLTQISNKTVLDLTLDSDSDDDVKIIEQNKKEVITLSDDESDDVTEISKPDKLLSPNISRNDSFNMISEANRLEEQKRYREILSLYTNVSLPEYSQSISPYASLNEKRNASDRLVDSINSTSSFGANESSEKSAMIDLTKDDKPISDYRFRKFEKTLSDSLDTRSRVNIKSYTAKFSSQSHQDSDLYTPVANGSIRGNVSHETSLDKSTHDTNTSVFDFTFVDKFRKALDPVQLERERQISVAEKQKEIAEKKRLEKIEKLKKEIESNKSTEFIPLTEEMLAKIKEVWRHANPKQVFAKAFDSEVTRSDLYTLKDSTWLNDEVVNFYFNLIKERNNNSDNLPKVHVFNTFFFPKIMKTGFPGVKRWTRKVDIFAMDLILVPVHLGLHWCLAVIDMKNKEIIYYDSLKGNNSQCLDALKNYLEEEMKDKKKTTKSFDDWKLLMPKDIPEQKNGCDCGVFMCKYAEYKSRHAPFTFKQVNMSYFRQRMVYEIISKKLL